jgi:hypothetical protein
MKFRLLTAALILAISAPLAFADDTSQPQPDAQKQVQQGGTQTANSAESTQPDPNRTVCKLEKPIGSVIPTRICKTAAQWQAERENSRKFMQDLQQRTGATHGG